MKKNVWESTSYTKNDMGKHLIICFPLHVLVIKEKQKKAHNKNPCIIKHVKHV